MKRLSYYYKRNYYERRKYDLERRYPSLAMIAETLVKKYKPTMSLDIGCAKGYLVLALRKLGVDAYGIDVSKYAISCSPEEVRGFLINSDVDFGDLPFKKNTLDLVTGLEVIEHLQNNNHVISEIKRVLKNGGILLLATPTSKSLDLLISALLGYHKGGYNPTHVNIHSRSFWIKSFQSAGFEFIGDFPPDIRKKINAARQPTSKIAELLVYHGGKIGKTICDELSFALRNPMMFFKKRK